LFVLTRRTRSALRPLEQTHSLPTRNPILFKRFVNPPSTER
jgi:hypothetical protein